jgi:hypothetical protein
LVRSGQTMEDYLMSCRKVKDPYLRSYHALENFNVELLGIWKTLTLGAVRS